MTLSGEGRRRILYMDTCDPAQKWTTSHCQAQASPQLVVQNLFLGARPPTPTRPDPEPWRSYRAAHRTRSPTPARSRPARSMLVTPGGFKAYFEALIDLITESGGIPPEQELRELGIAHGSVPA